MVVAMLGLPQTLLCAVCLWYRGEPVGLSVAGQRGSRGDNRQQPALDLVAGSVPHFRVPLLLLFARLS